MVEDNSIVVVACRVGSRGGGDAPGGGGGGGGGGLRRVFIKNFGEGGGGGGVHTHPQPSRYSIEHPFGFPAATKGKHSVQL